jgi:hypothetical protein
MYQCETIGVVVVCCLFCGVLFQKFGGILSKGLNINDFKNKKYGAFQKEKIIVMMTEFAIVASHYVNVRLHFCTMAGSVEDNRS